MTAYSMAIQACGDVLGAFFDVPNIFTKGVGSMINTSRPMSFEK